MLITAWVLTMVAVLRNERRMPSRVLTSSTGRSRVDRAKGPLRASALSRDAEEAKHPGSGDPRHRPAKRSQTSWSPKASPGRRTWSTSVFVMWFSLRSGVDVRTIMIMMRRVVIDEVAAGQLGCRYLDEDGAIAVDPGL